MVLSAPVQAKGGGYALGNTDITEVRRINASVSDLRLTSADFLKRSADLVVYLEREYEYDKTSLRNNYTVHFQMFYIFISEAGVDYTPDIAAYWLEVMRDLGKALVKTHDYHEAIEYCLEASKIDEKNVNNQTYQIN